MTRRKTFLTIKISLIVLFLFTYFAYSFFYNKLCYETRFAFDFGSGAIKSAAAEFDVCSGKIHHVFGRFEKQTRFITCLQQNESGGHHIDHSCVNRVINDFANFQAEYNISCSESKCAGVATAWARKADNAKEIAEKLQNMGINMQIISQEQEGRMSFDSVVRSLEKSVSPENVIVWDIGGGSFQLSTLDSDGKLHVYHGDRGIENFEKELRAYLNYPAEQAHPFFGQDDLSKAYDFAYTTHTQQILEKDTVLREKLKNPNVQVYAVGATKKIAHQMDLPKNLKISDLQNAADRFIGKTSAQVQESVYPKVSPAFVNSTQVSMILIQSIMRGMNIDEVHVADAHLTTSILYDEELWRKNKK